MELNREQIIKAMQDCIDRPKCIDCPNLTLCSGHGFEYLLVNALALIKELTEENEAISERYAIQVVTAIELDKQVQRLTEENERLTEELAKSYKSLDEQMNFYCSFTKSKIQNCPINDEIARAKADTVRKYHDKVEELIDCADDVNPVSYWQNDQIAKEMAKGK